MKRTTVIKISMMISAILFIISAGGVGYIPGKPVFVSFICLFVMAATGFVFTVSFSAYMKFLNYISSRPHHSRSRRSSSDTIIFRGRKTAA